MDQQARKKTIIIDDVEIPVDIHFLIVEDEPDVQELLMDTLVNLGFSGNVKFSESVVGAIEISYLALKKERKPIDFFISDWNLVDMTGLDFLKSIRANSAYKNTPFLMVTANDNVSGMLVATKQGASEYLVKPWNQEELGQKIAMCWNKKLPELPSED